MINDYSSEGILITIQHMYAEGNPRPDVFDPGSRDDSTPLWMAREQNKEHFGGFRRALVSCQQIFPFQRTHPLPVHSNSFRFPASEGPPGSFPAAEAEWDWSSGMSHWVDRHSSLPPATTCAG